MMGRRFALTLGLIVSGCGSDSVIEPWVLEDLHGAAGFSLRIPEFEVAAGRESQNCYFVRVPDLDGSPEIWVDRVLTAINPGSHHMNVFRVKTITKLDPAAGVPTMLGEYPATLIEGSDDYANNPCWGSANWADWPLIANSQKAKADELKTDWQLPTGVAIKLVPGEMLMVQTHYVNTADQPTQFGARVGINFFRYNKPNPPQELGSLFATQQNIRICQTQPAVTYSGTCRFPNAVTITAANGHFHKRGERFGMYSWDGASINHPADTSKFYESLNWDDAPMDTNLEIPAAANTGIWWDCAYRWQQPSYQTCDDVNAKDSLHQGDCCYTFGGNTDVGEHCNVFLYYYPKVESDVFCL